ncbi:MAG: nucleotide exchange factor GrpE [Mycobacteriaceae bacterium]
MAEHEAAQDARSGTSPPAEEEARRAPEEWSATKAELEIRIDELEDRWRRAVAELDNFRKRMARERADDRDVERRRVAAAWLPVLDNLDLALSHAGADERGIVEGIQAVRAQALAVLADLGFPRRQDDVGAMFDPGLHEAVGTVVQDDAPAGTVVYVARPGYGPDDRVLRPASVVVTTVS